MRRVAAAVLALALSGCAALPARDDYALQVGDRLKVVIFGELDEQALIRPDHKISLPIIGEVSTRKKTAEQLSQELTTKYHMPTVVMVQDYQTRQAVARDLLRFVRDILVLAFFALRRLSHG